MVCPPQVQEVQQELRSRAEQEVRLQRISCWISQQNRWVHTAPNSRAELQRSRAACQVRGQVVGVTGVHAHLCVCVCVFRLCSWRRGRSETSSRSSSEENPAALSSSIRPRH